MIRSALVLSFVLAASACLPTTAGLDENLAGQTVHLTVIHTSDIHSRLLPYDFSPGTTDQGLGLIPEAGPFGGAARMAALINREKAKSQRVLLLDSGDNFQGAPIFNLFKGEPEYRFQSIIGMNVSVIGNHEFDDGLANFTQKVRDFAHFPVLSANYIFLDPKTSGSDQTALFTEPYSIQNVRGIKVGVIGMANISSLDSIGEGGNSLQITPIEQNEAARMYVQLLKPVVDLVFIVSHLGLDGDQALIQGYDADFQYGRIKSFINRAKNPWTIVQWFGTEGEDSSVVEVHIPGVSGIDAIFGGHLHIVLNPPQALTDPSGRKVLIVDSGAFAKYVGRLDLEVKMPPAGGDAEGAEILSDHFRVFPIDALWCSDQMHAYYKNNFWDPGTFAKDPSVIAAEKKCASLEDPDTTWMLQPYILTLNQTYRLKSIFAYAPGDILRRNNNTGGDSELGNMLSDSMRKRQDVDAEVALTNSLGMRDNVYAGAVTQETMFNVFPFENTINIMYLSGDEMQDLFDYVTDRSAGRGCVSQGQISGARFIMDCAQTAENDALLPCKTAADCPADRDQYRMPWSCSPDDTGTGRCFAHTAENVTINGDPLDPRATYKIAVNDYIAKGGSGFKVLQRNTSRIETGIDLRDSLIGYMQSFCSCDDINAGRTHSSSGTPCGNLVNGEYVVAPSTKTFCQQAASFQTALQAKSGSCTCQDVLEGNVSACGEITDPMKVQCGAACDTLPLSTPPTSQELAQIAACKAIPGGPSLGECSCKDALDPTSTACGYVTQDTKNFCETPTSLPVAVGVTDGRIGRRIK